MEAVTVTVTVTVAVTVVITVSVGRLSMKIAADIHSYFNTNIHKPQLVK